jgi:Gpi18-like mannosyltransferase
LNKVCQNPQFTEWYTIWKGNKALETLINKIRVNGKEILLYVIFAGILCILLLNKVDFHIDELLTYNLANAESWFHPEKGVTYSPASQPFLDAMTSNGTFDLRHVWTQQANDTHPPLYYVLVHAVCTLFPNTFSIRYAGVINIIFQILTLYVVRKILMLMFGDKKITYIMSVMYILSAGILNISTFLRMYVMAMF